MAKTKPVELTGGETVLVACRVPMGLRLQLNEWHEVQEPGPAGPRTVRQSRRCGDPIVVHGPSKSYFDADHRRKIDFDLEGGFALTPVPRAFWDLWFEQYRTSDLIRNKLIFAADASSTKAQARELEKSRTAWEPLDANNPMAKSDRPDRLLTEKADVR
jgi:hypothetical protein